MSKHGQHRVASRHTGLTMVILALALSLMLSAWVVACGSDTNAPAVSSVGTGTALEENAAPESVSLTQKDDGGSVEIRQGGVIKVSLMDNPSTGYAWEMDDPDPEASLIEQMIEPQFVPGNPEVPDGKGILTFTFRAVDRGEMVIRLVHFPPDSAETPTETFQIDLKVR